MRAIAGSLVAVERKIVQAFKHGKSDRSLRLANSSPRARPRGSNWHALPRQHRRTRRLQFCRRPRFHDDPRGEARPVDVTAARAGGGRGICAHAQARRAQGVESALYGFTPEDQFDIKGS